MTGKEAKKEIIDMANTLQLIPNTPKGKAVSMALKALEQEPVLDKIRDEILEYIDDLDIATEICDIFDKYKVDMRGEE